MENIYIMDCEKLNSINNCGYVCEDNICNEWEIGSKVSQIISGKVKDKEKFRITIEKLED